MSGTIHYISVVVVVVVLHCLTRNLGCVRTAIPHLSHGQHVPERGIMILVRQTRDRYETQGHNITLGGIHGFQR